MSCKILFACTIASELTMIVNSRYRAYIENNPPLQQHILLTTNIVHVVVLFLASVVVPVHELVVVTSIDEMCWNNLMPISVSRKNKRMLKKILKNFIYRKFSQS